MIRQQKAKALRKRERANLENASYFGIEIFKKKLPLIANGAQLRKIITSITKLTCGYFPKYLVDSGLPRFQFTNTVSSSEVHENVELDLLRRMPNCF